MATRLERLLKEFISSEEVRKAYSNLPAILNDPIALKIIGLLMSSPYLAMPRYKLLAGLTQYPSAEARYNSLLEERLIKFDTRGPGIVSLNLDTLSKLFAQ